jgi:hypothetical protein
MMPYQAVNCGQSIAHLPKGFTRHQKQPCTQNLECQRQSIGQLSNGLPRTGKGPGA